MTRDLLHQELERDEGYREVAYQDSVGLWTIGIGHLLGTERRAISLTRKEIIAWCNADIDDAEAIAGELVHDFEELDDVRQRALVNMAFNLGRRLAGFNHFLAAVNARDWMEAGTHMADSLWAKQVGDRAVRLRHMIETGTT